MFFSQKCIVELFYLVIYGKCMDISGGNSRLYVWKVHRGGEVKYILNSGAQKPWDSQVGVSLPGGHPWLFIGWSWYNKLPPEDELLFLFPRSVYVYIYIYGRATLWGPHGGACWGFKIQDSEKNFLDPDPFGFKIQDSEENFLDPDPFGFKILRKTSWIPGLKPWQGKSGRRIWIQEVFPQNLESWIQRR